MASNITVDTLTKGGVTLNTDEIVDTNSAQVCKAWVNFNGTGTVAIRASYNVSSITDNGVGKYYINFSNAVSVDRCVNGSTDGVSGVQRAHIQPAMDGVTTLRQELWVGFQHESSHGEADYTHVMMSVFTD